MTFLDDIERELREIVETAIPKVSDAAFIEGGTKKSAVARIKDLIYLLRICVKYMVFDSEATERDWQRRKRYWRKDQ